MALTTNHSSVEVEKFTSAFNMEWQRFNQFAPYMGSSDNSIITVDRSLTTEKGGTYTKNLVRRIASGDGKVGNSTLEGNEIVQSAYGQKITVEYHREGIRFSKREMQRTKIDIMRAGRENLMGWKLDLLRDHIIREFGNITTPSTGVDGLAYAAATAAQKNEWLTGNIDRIWYGNANANTVVGDHAASIANIAAGQTMTGAILSAFKRKVHQTGDANRSRITPVRVKKDNNEEWLQVFMPTYVYRDFKDDPAVQQAQRDALPRGKNNPMFRGGDLIWDQMIIREIKEMGNVTEQGAGGIAVAPVYICGQTALNVGYAQMPQFPTEKFDYQFYSGVAVELDYAVRKAVWQGTDVGNVFSDYGVATGFFPNVADA